MTEENDTHGLPFGAREPLVLYALWRLWKSKNADKAADYKNDYSETLAGYLTFMAQSRQTKSKRGVQITFGDDLYTQNSRDIYN